MQRNHQSRARLAANALQIDQTAFIAPEILNRTDAARRQDRLAHIIADKIVPRLAMLHPELRHVPNATSPSESQVIELARLVLAADVGYAATFLTDLRDRGATTETLFVELIQPAARYLGTLWERDECDFVDVTLGVARLQKLLAIFNSTHNIPALSRKRRVFLTPTQADQHSLGLSMVRDLLSAAGWGVTVASEPGIKDVSVSVSRDWYAVAGITLSAEAQIDAARQLIATIRRKSRNPAIGIMVGGAQLDHHPELVARLGADATAADAPTAVVLAQKLFDIGALDDWQGTGHQV